MDGAKHPLPKQPLDAIPNRRDDFFLVLEPALALFHLAAQVGPGVEPVAIVGAIEIVQAVYQTPQHVFVDAAGLAGLGAA